jgi:thermostable 8-oxoguanine DNA glycosylase
MLHVDKQEKYKLVFNLAKKFLDEIISKHSGLNGLVLKRHLECEAKFENIFDVNRRLVDSLYNRNMMTKVIGFNKKRKEMEKILFGYDPNKILSAYKSEDELLKVFKKTFNLNNIDGKRSLWHKFTEGIISGSRFISSFKDKEEFNVFIKNFALNKYTKAALPMLLSKEIKGFGFALASDFIKELGYRDYPKPDVHLIKIFHDLDLSDSDDPYEVYKSIVEMAEAVNEDAYTVDKIFWLISSGRFYLVDIDTGRNRDKFIDRAIKEIFSNELVKN